MKLKWVEIRYRTKRGQRQKVRVVDIDGHPDKMVAHLTKAGAHSFDTRPV